MNTFTRYVFITWLTLSLYCTHKKLQNYPRNKNKSEIWKPCRYWQSCDLIMPKSGTDWVIWNSCLAETHTQRAHGQFPCHRVRTRHQRQAGR